MLFGKILTIVPEATQEPTIGTVAAPGNERAKSETVSLPAGTVLDSKEVVAARVSKGSVKDWLLEASPIAAGSADGAAVTTLLSYAVDLGADCAAGALADGFSARGAFPTESTLSIAGRVLGHIASSPEMKKLAAFVLRAGPRASGAAVTSLVGYAVDRSADGAVGALAGGIAAGGAFGF